MPSYHSLGQVPPKRHTQFRKPDGSLYSEELFGEEGFSGVYSLLYHQHPPTRVTRIAKQSDVCREEWPQETHRHHHLKTHAAALGGDPIEGRRLLMYNTDCTISVVRPTQAMEYFYRNAEADELLFVHEGQGTLETTFGLLPYREGDYLLVPRGTTYRVAPGSPEQRFLVVEAFGGPIEPPKRYRNAFGQLLEHSPYCERDLHAPTELPVHEERGEPVQLQYRRLRADHGPGAPAAAGPSDVRGPAFRRLLVLPAQAGLSSAGGSGPVQPQQHRQR